VLQRLQDLAARQLHVQTDRGLVDGALLIGQRDRLHQADRAAGAIQAHAADGQHQRHQQP
jgi:hypothetical protein